MNLAKQSPEEEARQFAEELRDDGVSPSTDGAFELAANWADAQFGNRHDQFRFLKEFESIAEA
jgi:hypothetical protein